jgi:type IV pilus assembly protein PilW
MGFLPEDKRGFTLVELMVVVAVSGLVAIAIMGAYKAQKRIMSAQEVVTDIQQNIRTVLFTLTQDIRMAGYDPTLSGGFGITFVGFRDLNDANAVGGNSAIQFTGDWDDGDDDGLPGPANGVVDGNETVTFSLYEFGAAGTMTDLAKTEGGGGRQLLAQNIQAIGLAYAYDVDNDKALDTYTTTAGTQQVIWAIDSDNDGTLDRRLDTNGDGGITNTDGPGAGVNELIVGAQISPSVPMADVRAVRIWLLAAESAAEQTEHYDPNTYVVGRQIISPRDNLRRRLVETTVQCKNMGLNE